MTVCRRLHCSLTYGAQRKTRSRLRAVVRTKLRVGVWLLSILHQLSGLVRSVATQAEAKAATVYRQAKPKLQRVLAEEEPGRSFGVGDRHYDGTPNRNHHTLPFPLSIFAFVTVGRT